MGFNSAFKGLKIVKNPGNGRLNNLNDPVLSVLKWLVLGNGGVDDVGREPSDRSDNAVSVAMAHWNVERRVFCRRTVF